MTTWITLLILVWFILRDWPKVMMNIVEIGNVIHEVREERYWKKRMGSEYRPLRY